MSSQARLHHEYLAKWDCFWGWCHPSSWFMTMPPTVTNLPPNVKSSKLEPPISCKWDCLWGWRQPSLWIIIHNHASYGLVGSHHHCHHSTRRETTMRPLSILALSSSSSSTFFIFAFSFMVTLPKRSLTSLGFPELWFYSKMMQVSRGDTYSHKN